MTKAIDLSPPELTLVRDILRVHLPAETLAWVFGSRATGSARRYSDLDVAVAGDAAFSVDVLGNLTEALSESDLPYRVDVIDLCSVDPAFRAVIERDMVPLCF